MQKEDGILWTYSIVVRHGSEGHNGISYKIGLMDKCQQLIDKVNELRFLKMNERQVNKFNRLLLKKQGNITGFSTVPPAGNPKATIVPQASSSLADSTVQTASTSSQIASSQASSTISQGGRAVQPVNSWAISMNSEGYSAMPPQAECTDAQAARTSPLTVSTNSQGVSVASPVSSQAIQAECADAQAASASTLTLNTNLQDVSDVPPVSSQAIQTGSSQASSQIASSQASSTISQGGRAVQPVNSWAISMNSEGYSAMPPRQSALMLRQPEPLP